MGELIYAFWIIPVIVLIKLKKMPKIGRGMNRWDYFSVYVALLIIPNSTYAMLEVRHVLFVDHVADNPNFWTFLVFGGISLIGLLTTVYGTRLIIDYYAKSKIERLFYNTILSLACGFGAVAGLLNFISLPVVIFPPALLAIALELYEHPIFIALAMAITIFLFGVNLFVDYLFNI